MGLARKWQALLDAVLVGGVHRRCPTKIATALGPLSLGQMSQARGRTQHFAGCGDLKSLCRGLFGLNAFGTTHKKLNQLPLKKSAQYMKMP